MNVKNSPRGQSNTGHASLPKQRYSDLHTALTPRGVLRLAFPVNSNLYVMRDAETGDLSGLSPDLGKELAIRLGVPIKQQPYNSISELILAGREDQWDIATVIIDPAREQIFDYTKAYIEADATYLVPSGSLIRLVNDADNSDVRIGVSEKSAFDLFLTRSLKKATLVRYQNVAAAFKGFRSAEVEAVAAPRQLLLAAQRELAGSRVIEDWFDVMRVGIALPKGRHAAGVSFLNQVLAALAASGWMIGAIRRREMIGVRVAPELLV